MTPNADVSRSAAMPNQASRLESLSDEPTNVVLVARRVCQRERGEDAVGVVRG